jgi:hypothetical protein
LENGALSEMTATNGNWGGTKSLPRRDEIQAAPARIFIPIPSLSSGQLALNKLTDAMAHPKMFLFSNCLIS